MKVVCVRIINSVTGKEEDRSPWLELGKEYVVLAIFAPFGSTTSFLLVSDDTSKLPVPFDANQFEIVSGSMAATWKASLDKEGHLQIAPEKWLRKDFWLDFYDREPEALNDFRIEANRILHEFGSDERNR